MLFLTKRRVLCTHILEAYIFKDFNNRKIPLNINPLNYIIPSSRLISVNDTQETIFVMFPSSYVPKTCTIGKNT